jgi:hypothetical protein
MPSDLQRITQELLATLNQVPHVVAHLQRTAAWCRQQVTLVHQIYGATHPNGRELILVLDHAAHTCDHAAHTPPKAHAWAQNLTTDTSPTQTPPGLRPTAPPAAAPAPNRVSADPDPGQAEDDIVAEAGPAAPTGGHWESTVMRVRGKLPRHGGSGSPNSKKVGTRWFDTAAAKANGVRIDQGVPGSVHSSQQVDHVIIRSGGNVLGPGGLPITGSIKKNPQAHIPLSDWLNWSSWDMP